MFAGLVKCHTLTASLPSVVEVSSAVQDILALELDLLMSEEAATMPAGLRPALGRLANAMVAVLGPELSLGSDAYTKTRSLLQDLQVSRRLPLKLTCCTAYLASQEDILPVLPWQ